MNKMITTVIGIECTDKDSKQIGLLIRDKPEFTPILARSIQDEKDLEIPTEHIGRQCLTNAAKRDSSKD